MLAPHRRGPTSEVVARYRFARSPRWDSLWVVEANDVADMQRPLPRGALPLQRLAMPVRQLRRGCGGFLQKSKQELVGVACPTHGVVGENELPESLVVKGVRRGEPGAAVAGRLRISVDEECRAAVTAVAGPKAAA